jgi:hypothetical protein
VKHSLAAKERLRMASLAELEATYASAPLAPLPGGVWRGTYLHELPMSTRDRLVARAMFKWPTFGLDLDEYGWWFGSPKRVIGHFEPAVGRSRWRDAEVVRLDYRRTTPWPLRRMLYDELKPLDGDCVLGLGGINRSGPRGAWFYFLLERR